jgi:hypothetical protein
MSLLLCFCNAIAQDYYLKTIDIDNTSSDNGLRILPETDGYVILCGSVTAVGEISICKSDLQGNKIWDNTISNCLMAITSLAVPKSNKACYFKICLLL